MKVSHKEQGLALLMLVFLLALVAIGYGVNALDSSGLENERNKKTALALTEAKAALLGTVIGVADATTPVYLPNPDVASPPGNAEGVESLSFGNQDYSIVGKFPWKTLDIAPLKDGWGECLWYVVSGRFKKSPHTSIFNWDTQGQINILDANGSEIASNVAALIISPASPLAGQSRALINAKYTQCGGNYEPNNYLDTYTISNSVAGEVNYFLNSTDHRKASNKDNKNFVLANNDFYNDKFTFITVDDIFDSLVKRSDFVNEINIQLNNARDDINNFVVPVSGDMGTDGINCNPNGVTLKTDTIFCENWKEMFLMKENGSVNGTSCSKVFIFAGKRTGAQVRLSGDDKRELANYLEEPNLSQFNGAGLFIGATNFDGNNPSADVFKCI